jgi:hypothetical protein
MQHLLKSATTQPLDPVKAAKVRRYVRRTKRPLHELVVSTSVESASASAVEAGDVDDAVAEVHLATAEVHSASAETDLAGAGAGMAVVRFPLSQIPWPDLEQASNKEATSQKADSESTQCPKAPKSVSHKLPPQRKWIFEQALLLERVRAPGSLRF